MARTSGALSSGDEARLRANIRSNMSKSVWIAVLFLGLNAGGCALTADKSASEKDIEECNVLSEAVLGQYDLPPAQRPSGGRGGRALYCGMLQRNPFIPNLHTHVTVYGIRNDTEQDRVLKTLRAARRPEYKPIVVEFFDRESIESFESEGGSGWRRGSEVRLRREVIR